MSSNQNSKHLIAENIEVNDSRIGVSVNRTNGYDNVAIKNATANRCDVGFQIGEPLSPRENLKLSLPSISPSELSTDQIDSLIKDLLTSKSKSEMEEKFSSSSLREKIDSATAWVNFGNALLPLISLMVVAANNF